MSKGKTPTWGLFSDLPGYSGHFSNFNLSPEPPADYDDVTGKSSISNQQSTIESSEQDDADGNAKSLLRVFTRFAERTSMQGVPYIQVSKHPIAKVMWVVFLLLAMAAMSLHLFYLFNTYYSFSKTTQVLLGFSNLQFPAVTVCNMNPIRKSQLKRYGSEELRDFIDDIKPSELVTKLRKLKVYRPNSDGDEGEGSTGGDKGEGSTGGDKGEGSTGGDKGEGSTGGDQGESTTSGDQGESPTVGNKGESQGGGSQAGDPSGGDAPKATPTPSGLNRKKRFVDAIKFNFTNKRDKFKDANNHFEEEHKFFSGEKSSFHVIRDQFMYLLFDHSRDIRQQMGHQIKSMLMDCSFDGVKCDHHDFTLVPSSAFGNCYTLENKRFIVRRNGPPHGLELTLFLETQEFLRGISTGNGIVAQIHQPGTWAFPEDNGLFISTYQETNIAMRMKNIYRMGPPYGICETGHSYRQLYNLTYTRQTCQSICYSKSLFVKCNCYDDKDELMMSISNFSNAVFPTCESDTEFECQMKVEQQWESGAINCICPNPCRENSYRRLLSSRNWPSDEYSTLLLEYICDKLTDSECQKYTKMSLRQLNLNFLKLNIFFEDLNYENVTEVASYENSQFLSDIGGTIGLWIGLSLLSIAEVGQFICELLHYLCYVKIKQTTQRKNKRRWNSASKDIQRTKNVVQAFYPQSSNGSGPLKKHDPLPDRLSSNSSSFRKNNSLF